MNYDIRKLSLKDYENVILEVKNYLCQFSIVRSIYRIGGISAPGISDLDLVVVLDDDAKSFTLIWNQYLMQCSEESKYIFTHHPFIINEKNFSNGDFLKIFPIFDIEHIYGNIYSFDFVYDRYSKIANYLDSNLPFWQFEFEDRGFESVRQSLLRLHSFLYPLKMINDITGFECQDAKRFIHDIKSLRAQAFTTPKTELYERIRKLNATASRISLIINSNFSTYIRSEMLNVKCDFRITVDGGRYIATNINRANITSELLINAYIYFNISSDISKYYNNVIFVEYDDGLDKQLENNIFYNELKKCYMKKVDVYSDYINWLIENQLGWGALSTPLYSTFLSYYCTAPEHYNNKVKHWFKMLISDIRFFWGRKIK